MDIFEYIDRVKANFDKQPEPRYNTKKYFMGGSVTTPKRGLVDEPGSYAGNQGKGGNKLAGGEATKAKYIAQRAEMDKWLNNWLDNNFKNYGVRDKEKYLKDLKKDFKKAKKTQFKNNSVAQSGDLPTVSPRKTVRKKDGKIIGFFDNKNFFKMFDESLLVSQANSPEKDRFYKRLFYAGQIDTNPKLKKDIDNYFKTIALNKGRGFGFTEAELKKTYEVIASNPDVPYMLSSDAEINASMKQTLFEKRFKSYKPYREKVSAANINYKKNIKNLEKITGIPITKQIKKEHNSLKKILDISTLPDELKYSIDHLYGVSEAVKNPKNKKFATEVANNLIGGTAFQNTNAGFGGYSVKRKSLINNINEGKNVTKSLNRLNELTTEFYPKFKNLKQPYKIVNGELTFAKGFKGETQPERFTSYFKEIDKTKQGKQLIKKEYGSLRNLIKAIGCPNNKAMGGRIGFQDGTNCFKKGEEIIQSGKPAKGAQFRNFVKLGQVLAKTGKTAAGAADILLSVGSGTKGLGVGLLLEAGFAMEQASKGQPGLGFSQTILGDLYNAVMPDEKEINLGNRLLKSAKTEEERVVLQNLIDFNKDQKEFAKKAKRFDYLYNAPEFEKEGVDLDKLENELADMYFDLQNRKPKIMNKDVSNILADVSYRVGDEGRNKLKGFYGKIFGDRQLKDKSMDRNVLAKSYYDAMAPQKSDVLGIPMLANTGEIQNTQKQLGLPTSYQASPEELDDIYDMGRLGAASGGMARASFAIGGFTKAQFIIQRMKNSLKQAFGKTDPDSKYVNKTFPNMIKEIEAKPELANNENVFKMFSEDLPKNQRVVVHSDDSLDFFQQSDFGPHNIKPTIKFAEDNNISIAEAKKILKMEPEDQVLEKTRLQVLKDKGRTRQASGGLTSLTRTTPPERGPNSQGLASFMKNGMK